jgi:hypothetical protein
MRRQIVRIQTAARAFTVRALFYLCLGHGRRRRKSCQATDRSSLQSDNRKNHSYGKLMKGPAMKRLLAPALLSQLLCAAACLAAQPPKHLTAAIDLASRLSLEDTSYQGGEPKVTWEGTCQSHADCSGFLDALLMHSYGYSKADFKRWFDSHRPSARRYHDAIVAQKGFQRIDRLADVQPGDVLAVKYLRRTDNTGHVMLVAAHPRRITPTQPVVGRTEQWEVAIIDSSRSGHGPTDTRHRRGPDGKDHDGLGRGILRIYSNSQGAVAGFSWSTTKASKFVAPSDEHLVIGRLIPGFKPAREQTLAHEGIR